MFVSTIVLSHMQCKDDVRKNRSHTSMVKCTTWKSCPAVIDFNFSVGLMKR